jgi:hypothetical protein
MTPRVWTTESVKPGDTKSDTKSPTQRIGQGERVL